MLILTVHKMEFTCEIAYCNLLLNWSYGLGHEGVAVLLPGIASSF